MGLGLLASVGMLDAPDPDRFVTLLRGALRDAMKRRDLITRAALRSLLAAIDNAGAVAVDSGGQPGARAPAASLHVAGSAAGVGAADVERRRLTSEDLAAIVGREHDERQAAADDYEQRGAHPEAERLRAEAAVIARWAW